MSPLPLPRRPWRARTAACALAVATACGDATAPAPTDPRGLFDDAWRRIDRHYAFFDHFGVDWPAERARWGATLTMASTDAETRAAVCGLVDALHSRHAWLATPVGGCSWERAPRYPAGYAAPLVEPLLVAPRTTAGQRIRWARLDPAFVAGDSGGGVRGAAPSVGYLRIPSFAGGGWGDDVDQALAALPDVRAIVIDVRANPGGNEAVARQVAGRFADRERVYRLARFRAGARHDAFTPTQETRLVPAGRRFAGPVAVLIDRDVHSAAEDFAMMMRVQPGAVLVGDTTFGTSSNPRDERLGNGWLLRIPQSVQLTPDGLVVEGHGIPPALPARLDAADAARGVDTVLRAAVRELVRRLGS